MEFRIHDVLGAMPKSEEEFASMDADAIEEYQAGAKRRDEIHRSVVFGHDHKVRKGEPIEQGIGAQGRESANHFISIRRYEGEDAYWSAVGEIHKRDPKRHAALKLPHPNTQPKPKAA